MAKLKTPRVYDPAEFLDSPEVIAEYLTEALESDDAAIIAKAISTIARAQGMGAVAESAGVDALDLKALRQLRRTVLGHPEEVGDVDEDGRLVVDPRRRAAVARRLLDGRDRAEQGHRAVGGFDDDVAIFARIAHLGVGADGPRGHAPGGSEIPGRAGHDPAPGQGVR